MSNEELLKKAKLFLKSRNNELLLEILALFDNEKCNNFSPVLMAVEMIFAELLSRKDIIEDITPSKAADESPAAVQCRWLREAFARAKECILSCFRRGVPDSREQAMICMARLLKEEGSLGIGGANSVFPGPCLNNIIATMLDDDESMSGVIRRFQELAQLRDVQQFGLQLLSLKIPRRNSACGMSYDMTEDERQAHLAICNQHPRTPTNFFMRNYLEVLHALLLNGLPTGRSRRMRHPNDRYLSDGDGQTLFVFNTSRTRQFVNRCWEYVMQWPLEGTPAILKMSLALLVDHVIPHLKKPQLVVDLLANSMDREISISCIALRGLLMLLTYHSIEYPNIYDRLYDMFDPELFCTRSKKQLYQLAEVFLRSDRMPLVTAAAFAKRLSRLAVLAAPEDACGALDLVTVILINHPGLHKMIVHDDPPVMPQDPYVAEETNVAATRAINSSLWEVSTMRAHFTPDVCQAATFVLVASAGKAPQPRTNRQADAKRFDEEIRRRYRKIQLNYERESAYLQLPSSNTLARVFDDE